MELHPDRNKSANSTNSATPSARAAYDILSTTERRNTTSSSKSAAPPDYEPVGCSVCSKITAQPRYVIFWEVKSAIFVTYRTPIQGIFCTACAEKKALRATLVTWIVGW